MKLRQLALAALAVTSIGAQAGLTSYAPWDATFAANGLAGVQFNVNSAGGATVALGSHAYKNGVTLPNNGTDTYYARSGLYAPDGLNRANWSFDFSWALGTSCQGCTVHLLVDKDPTGGTNFVDLFAATPVTIGSHMDSWNMEMGFMTAGVYDFNPFVPSSTGFQLQVLDAAGALVVGSDITVNVPEPGTIALLGLALAGMGVVRRRGTKA